MPPWIQADVRVIKNDHHTGRLLCGSPCPGVIGGCRVTVPLAIRWTSLWSVHSVKLTSSAVDAVCQ
jgi:hypothetical protein